MVAIGIDILMIFTQDGSYFLLILSHLHPFNLLLRGIQLVLFNFLSMHLQPPLRLVILLLNSLHDYRHRILPCIVVNISSFHSRALHMSVYHFVPQRRQTLFFEIRVIVLEPIVLITYDSHILVMLA